MYIHIDINHIVYIRTSNFHILHILYLQSTCFSMFFLGQEGTSTVERMVSKQLSLERAMEDPWAQGDQEFVQNGGVLKSGYFTPNLDGLKNDLSWI